VKSEKVNEESWKVKEGLEGVKEKQVHVSCQAPFIHIKVLLLNDCEEMDFGLGRVGRGVAGSARLVSIGR
jgi:hypothetical protein